MIVYGRNPVREALRGRRRVRRVWVNRRTAGQGWLATASAPVTVVGDDELEQRAETRDHQGVCAEADPYPYADAGALVGATPDALVVCLDQVQDPRNLGAVGRVAECAGAAGLVIPERRAAEVTPVACKASAGAIEHLPVARVRNIADFLGEARAAGAWIYGAAAGATVSYERPDYRGRVVIVLGSEGGGLRPRVAAACDELVALPLRGRVGSLNVSAAAAALIYGVLLLRERPA
jgi:23S rRNA (guanosine2251-2'-O)-methyltransferase